MRHVPAGAMMVRSFPRVGAELPLHEAVAVLAADQGRTAVVVDATGALVGTIGRREILQALSVSTGRFYTVGELGLAHIRPESFDSATLRRVWREFWDTPVHKVMRTGAPSVDADRDLSVAGAPLWEDPSGIVVIVKGHIPIGVLEIEQVLGALRPVPEQVRDKTNPSAPRTPCQV